ncbi:MAG: aldehyde dehydrogenase family protein [Proteobacteria bacterium]|nr:aldehyde dehydrogenase family protein [Pseudomonadota bacterium]
MATAAKMKPSPNLPKGLVLPTERGLFYGGAWHAPLSKKQVPCISPATGEVLCDVAEAGANDVDRAVRAAHAAFAGWRKVKPLERAALLRRIAALLRDHVEELALLDAADCGNPVREMTGDVKAAAMALDYFAGLVTEMKGETIPMGEGVVNYTLREPLGVVARIIPFNHPLMFAAMKAAAPLAAGNTLVLKPPEQSPLTALRLAELIDGILPPGVFNVLPGGRECGAALASHPLVAKVALIGSVPTGKAVLRAAADGVKPVSLELGGKNALIVYPDADVKKATAGAVRGMNFTWCGQSCGSTSRAFLHANVHDQVLDGIVAACKALKPSLPTDMACNMGAIVSREQLERVKRYVAWGKEDGARLVAGGKEPDDPRLRNGFFFEPTVFAGVTPQMRIGREEIFGPVLSVLKWNDEEEMLAKVNAVDYGLTASIWTRDLTTAHRAAGRVQAGYVWVNNSGAHFLGAPFGGYKQSGLGREECLDELLSYTQIKNVNITLDD